MHTFRTIQSSDAKHDRRFIGRGAAHGREFCQIAGAAAPGVTPRGLDLQWLKRYCLLARVA